VSDSPLDAIRRYHDELTEIRRDLHANPELGLEEYRTADVVAAKLAEWGIEVHRGVGGTGVVGVLRSGNGEQAIGLRADMDALPILEANEIGYRSGKPGVMHACGHDNECDGGDARKPAHTGRSRSGAPAGGSTPIGSPLRTSPDASTMPMMPALRIRLPSASRSSVAAVRPGW
jgi:hypothetical protein